MQVTRKCPACRVPLDPVYVPDKYGRETQLDQCPECRGIYFDRDELFRMGPALLDPLQIVAPSPTASLQRSGGGQCPGCGGGLSRLQSYNLPQTVHAWQCQECLGFWFSEEDLYEFYQFRKMQIAGMKKRKPNTLMVAVARDQALSNLGKDIASKIVYPVALMASPWWIAAGATAVEKLWRKFVPQHESESGPPLDIPLPRKTEKKKP